MKAISHDIASRRVWCLVLIALLFPTVSRALTNNLALTPPMGWNDWNAYGCSISEFIVTNNAGLIVSDGLKAAGYQYVDIDDGWASSRDSNGVIQAYSISTKFPDGIPWLANYVHSLGLKLGVYTDNGTNTCSSCITGATPPKDPGSYNREYIDAFTYAEFGADYLKDDNCNATGLDGQTLYSRMSDGLMKSGRPILFCLCGGEAGNAKSYQSWSPDVGNYWRTTGDIGSTFASMISHIDPDSTSAFVAGPGRWNDPDMMEIGNGEFATDYVAAQTHFTMWCIMAAPLVMGNNLTTLSAQSLAILTNAEVIAVDQDPAGEQGTFVGGVKDSAEVWSKPLGYDFTTHAVALLNRSTNSSATITCYFTNLAFQAGTTATVRDLVAHQDLGTFTNSYTATIPAYGSMLLKIVGTPIPPPGLGTNYLSDIQPIYAYTGSGTIVPDESIGGHTITLGGVTYPHGIGVNSRSGVEYNLGGVCSRFQATLGIDDEVGSSGTVIFEVFADGTRIYESGVMTGSTPATSINLDVTGVRRLTLGVDDDNDGTGNDHADWANALVIATNTPQMPEAPAGLVASPGNAITLNWNTTLAGITYNVKRGIQTGGPYTNIANVPITTFTDSNVVSGTTYYYVVSAVSSLGEGSNSMEAFASPCNVPAAPTNVMTAAGSSSVTVNWNASAGATSYNVYRFTGSTPPVLIGTNITVTNFTDTPVAASSTNYYLVTAANDCNQSGYSFYAAIVTPPGPPGTPTGLNATPGNALVNLSWNAATNATGYNVKRSTTNSGPYTVIASNITTTAYLDTTVINGTNYYYVVSALNVGGESPNSTQVSVTPVAPVTAYWTNTTTATAQGWNVNANWTNTPVFPNAVGELAIVNAGLVAPQTINLNQSITLGALEIGDANSLASYTLAANGGSLTFDDVNPVSITQLATSKGDDLVTPVSLLTNLIVINDSVNPLTLAGPLSSSGGAALMIGSGALQIGDGTTDGSLGSVNVTDNGALIFNCIGSPTNSGTISGSGSLTNSGSGTVTLTAAETYTGPTVVNAGILALAAGNNGNSGPYESSGIIINNGGTVQVNIDNSLTGNGNNPVPVTINAGGTLTGLGTYGSGGGTDTGTSTHIRGVLYLNGGTLTDGGSQNIPGWGTWNLDGGVVVNGGPNTSTIGCLDVTPTESLGTVFNVAAGGTPSGIDLLVSGTLIHGTSSGDTGIIKTGNGTMALANVNTYTGNTFVNGGTLALTGSGSINSSVQVAINNATFDLSGLAAAACANSQFSLTNAMLKLAISATPTTDETANSLNLGGATNLIKIASLPAISTFPQRYHLINYTTLNGTFNIGLDPLPTLPGGMVVTGYVANASGYVDLVISTNGAANRQLVWTGTDASNPNNWDVSTSENWETNGVTTTYNQGDVVRFDDSATGQTNIYLTTVLAPGSLTVSNNVLIYDLGAGGQGGGRISGVTGLSKQGTNVLILDEGNTSGSYNDFSGGLTINAGTVQVGNGDQNGSPGTGSVIDNGALVFDRSDNVTNSSAISGSGSVAQEGTGILTVNGANTFSGGVAIQNGTLQAGNTAALGPVGGSVVITNGGTLDVNGLILTGTEVTVSGYGVGGNGAIINTAGQQTYALRNVTLAGDTVIGGVGPFNPTANTNRWDIRAASNSSTNGCTLSTGGHPYELIKTGTNQISLVAVDVDPALGDIDIQQGLMGWETATASMGNPASNLIVRAGATLSFYNATTAWNKNFILYGNGAMATVTNWSGANVVIGSVQLNGNCVFAGGGTSLTLSNAASGTGGIVKNGTYTLILSGTNTYTGSTTINAGSLNLIGNGSISSSTNINVNVGATLNASGRGDITLTLASGQTLTGNGAISGKVIVSSGATFAPGSPLGTLTFSTNLTLNGGSTTVMAINKSVSPSNVLAQVAGNLSYGGTLVITNLGAVPFAAGDSFKLFNAIGYAGAFTNIVPAIPAVNLAWNTNNLSSGILSIMSSSTPPPKFENMAANGNNFIFSGTNGVPNWTYYVLASTNLDLPLTDWTIVSTNAFDGGGNFNFTNLQNPMSPQTFYLLKLQ
ncbi:MAG TPA: NPCBM/NEW2 domain-containing protein [Candidatus Aquilonibacter sp.]|nr:NPCBM/NEW2 domain-containing protein [Candidatus Aquilonibacter sp.]